jgi:hypothetical protein
MHTRTSIPQKYVEIYNCLDNLSFQIIVLFIIIFTDLSCRVSETVETRHGYTLVTQMTA